MKSRDEIFNWIVALESELPVESWKIDGICVWPLLRRDLFMALVSKVDDVKVESSTPGGHGLIRSLHSLIRSAVSSIPLLIRSRNEYVVFSGARSHRIDQNNELYNRYFDPMMDYLEGRGRFAVMVEQSQRESRNYYRGDRVIFLQDYLPFARLLNWVLSLGKTKFELSNYQTFLTRLREIHSMVEINLGRWRPDMVARKVSNLKAHAIAFRLIFWHYRVKASFGLCYYSTPMYAMNLSAARSGIVSVDMQHGSQGPLHFGYAGYQKQPEREYDLLPNVFWCWDESSAKEIEKWIRPHSRFRAIVGGNPWLKFTHDEEYVSKIPSNMILYTMQPAGDLLDRFIIDSIKKTKDRFSWWLRLHPRQLNDKSKLIDLLDKENLIDFVNINEAFTFPLPSLLRRAVVHISKFSGSIQEASILGTPSIILHPIGALAFDEYIKKGIARAYLGENVDELAQHLDQCAAFHSTKAITVDFQPILDELTK